MSQFDNLKDQAAQALQNEEQTDSLLDKAGEFANEKTGGQYADKIDQAKQAADERLGEQG